MKPAGQQLVHLVLTLAGDSELDILPNVVGGKQLALAQELGALVQSFNFLDSVAFEETTRGKSGAFVDASRRRVMEPVKRGELKKEFYDHVRRILSDGKVELYLPASAAGRVADIRRKLNELNAT